MYLFIFFLMENVLQPPIKFCPEGQKKKEKEMD